MSNYCDSPLSLRAGKRWISPRALIYDLWRTCPSSCAMARIRRPARCEGGECEEQEEWLKRTDKDRKVERVVEGEPRRSRNLVQTALTGEVGDYVIPDHEPGESFPGRQPATTQLSLFDAGFKRKSGQISLFEAGFKRRARLGPPGVCC